MWEDARYLFVHFFVIPLCLSAVVFVPVTVLLSRYLPDAESRVAAAGVGALSALAALAWWISRDP